MEVERKGITAFYEPIRGESSTDAAAGENEHRKVFEVLLAESANLEDLMRGLDQMRSESNTYFGQLIDEEKERAKEKRQKKSRPADPASSSS